MVLLGFHRANNHRAAYCIWEFYFYFYTGFIHYGVYHNLFVFDDELINTVIPFCKYVVVKSFKFRVSLNK